jgi:hypothetical protein
MEEGIKGWWNNSSRFAPLRAASKRIFDIDIFIRLRNMSY